MAAGFAAGAAPFVIGVFPVREGLAQQGPAGEASVRFEVVSVKPAAAGSGGTDGTKSGGAVRDTGFQVGQRRFAATNVNLFALIVKAYGISGCRPLGGGNCPLLAGGPEWLKSRGFDIQATMPPGSSEYTMAEFQNGRTPQLQLMLQAMLAERFGLVIRREKRRVDVFALTVGAKGLKIRKSGGRGEGRVFLRPVTQPAGEMIQLVAENSSIADVAELYSKFMARPVVDRTGLTGRFDFTMEYEADSDAPGPFSAATGPGLFRAFQDQAGLKLAATKDLVEVLVIDRAAAPTEN